MNDTLRLFDGGLTQQTQKEKTEIPKEQITQITKDTSVKINDMLAKEFGINKKQNEQYVEYQLAQLFGQTGKMDKLNGRNSSKLSLNKTMMAADDYFSKATA